MKKHRYPGNRLRTKYLLITILVLRSLAGAWPAPAKGILSLNGVAEEYVRLALLVGAYAPGYIDAYYGPGEWKIKNEEDLRRGGFQAVGVRKRAESVLRELNILAGRNLSALDTLRLEFLKKQMIALKAEIDALSGIKFTFDQESQLFYDAVSPARRREEFEKKVALLEAALPGEGSLQERVAAFKNEFIIPAAKLPAVFEAAIAECRRRTLAHIALPANESFKAAYVQDKPWGAYNWYKGNAYSLIEVNTDLPMQIDSAVRIAAHEGYPGHHVYNVLLEQKLAKEKGWSEFTVYPLFSPQSLIAEGTANYGIELIFPGDEKLQFEIDKLYPLAGIDPQKAGKLAQVQKLVDELRYAENEAARGYLDGAISREEALDWLARFSLESPERAAKTIDFWNAYRSYIINYNLGQDIVRAFVEKTAGMDSSLDGNGRPLGGLEAKWRVFIDILSTPRTPSGLQQFKEK
ncbi:MAG: hypothetical protein NTW95_12345 [Candidatus Aminicenantes bacterium]|nr:hypothetical protein [Candidatus Aminicenantes bacterium]